MARDSRVLVLIFLAACVPEHDVAMSHANLQGAVADKTTTSVMFFNTTSNKCTATMVGTNSATGVGWAISDEHCYSPTVNGLLFQSATATVQDNDITYPYEGTVLDSIFFDSGINLMEISGVTDSTPVMPLVDPCDDPVTPGSIVRLVSYGEPLDGIRAVRRSVEVEVDAVGPVHLFIDAEPTAAVCDRDQGGAVIADTPDGPRLVGVITQVNPSGCDGNIVANRLSPWMEAFITPRLTGDSSPTVACLPCIEIWMDDFTCNAESVACSGDPACVTARSDALRCSDEACLNNLASGNAAFSALLTCASGNCREGQLCTESQCSSDVGGVDAGPSGTPDAGTPAIDAGTPAIDAGTAGDGGGGGCRVGQGSPYQSIPMLFALAWLIRRRRERQS